MFAAIALAASIFASPWVKYPACWSKTESFWGPMIASYSRAEAIEDGALIDVTEVARAVAVARRGRGGDERCVRRARLQRGREHRRGCARGRALGNDESNERAPFAVNGRWLYALAHPGDEGEACVTIMLEGED
jgi:hypothetical protein